MTYPLTTACCRCRARPRCAAISLFGDSFVYVIFKDGTDLYWARSRVLEYLSQVAPRLPRGARPALGPDATGVGWVYQYALVDRTGRHDLAQLRSLQDWFLKYELQRRAGRGRGRHGRRHGQAVSGGGRPAAAARLPPDAGDRSSEAIENANRETGGSVDRDGRGRVHGARHAATCKSVEDLRRIPLGGRRTRARRSCSRESPTSASAPRCAGASPNSTARARSAGGIVVMRHGENALATIEARQGAGSTSCKRGLPEGVEIVADLRPLGADPARGRQPERHADRGIHRRGAGVPGVPVSPALVAGGRDRTLPLGILDRLHRHAHQGINANIMSLGGIAIAIGAMVDAAIVMIENVHKHLEHEADNRRTAGSW